MRYEGRIFRPPSEGRSYILQATIGCRHNACAFCDMYKEKRFRVRTEKEIVEDLQMAAAAGYRPKRVFIADGDALSIGTQGLLRILQAIDAIFPQCERIGIYGTAQDILEKGEGQLRMLKDAGLGIVYLGLESGSDKILKKMRKGVSSSEMIEAAMLAKRAGMPLSVTAISGLGGTSDLEEHAQMTGSVLSAMDPDYIGLLTLMLEPGTEVYKWTREGSFIVPGPRDVLFETKLLVEQLEVSDCTFRSNHASNYVSLKAQLPYEKDVLLQQIDRALQGHHFKPEGHRML